MVEEPDGDDDACDGHDGAGHIALDGKVKRGDRKNGIDRESGNQQPLGQFANLVFRQLANTVGLDSVPSVSITARVITATRSSIRAIKKLRFRWHVAPRALRKISIWLIGAAVDFNISQCRAARRARLAARNGAPAG